MWPWRAVSFLAWQPASSNAAARDSEHVVARGAPARALEDEWLWGWDPTPASSRCGRRPTAARSCGGGRRRPARSCARRRGSGPGCCSIGSTTSRTSARGSVPRGRPARASPMRSSTGPARCATSCAPTTGGRWRGGAARRLAAARLPRRAPARAGQGGGARAAARGAVPRRDRAAPTFAISRSTSCGACSSISRPPGSIPTRDRIFMVAVRDPDGRDRDARGARRRTTRPRPT